MKSVDCTVVVSFLIRSAKKPLRVVVFPLIVVSRCWLAGCLTGWLAGFLVSCLVGWLIGLLVVWLVV